MIIVSGAVMVWLRRKSGSLGEVLTREKRVKRWADELKCPRAAFNNIGSKACVIMED